MSKKPDPTKTSTPVRRRVITTAEENVSLSDLREKQKQADKERFLQALDRNLGIITHACNSSGVPRRTVYKWLAADPEFQRRVTEVDHKQVDYVERKLIEVIDKHDTRAIIFYLSTKGRNRGYTTRVEVMTPPGEAIRTEVKVDHQDARDEMGDKALGKALRAAALANPGAFGDVAIIGRHTAHLAEKAKGAEKKAAKGKASK